MQSFTLQLYSYPFSLPLASERSSLPASPYPMNDPCHTTSFVKSLLSYFGPSHIPPPWEHPETQPHTSSLGPSSLGPETQPWYASLGNHPWNHP